MTVTCPNVDSAQYNLTITFLDTIAPDATYLDVICGTCATVIVAAPDVPEQP